MRTYPFIIVDFATDEFKQEPPIVNVFNDEPSYHKWLTQILNDNQCVIPLNSDTNTLEDYVDYYIGEGKIHSRLHYGCPMVTHANEQVISLTLQQ
jgi:hypothetical protein